MIRQAWTAIALLVAACASDDAKLGAPTAVKLAIVQPATAPAGTRYSAQIAPATTIKVSFKVGGYVESVATVPDVDGKPRWIQAGDPVREGIQLVALRKTEFLNGIAEARAGRAQASATGKQARIDLTRASALAARDAIAGAEVDTARTRMSAASASVAGAKARYDDARMALTDATLRSPLDGIVLERAVGEGELVAAGSIAFVVADVSHVKAEFGVPDTMLSRIAIGMAETVTSEAYPGETFEGTISMIAPSADPRSRVFDVAVTIPNGDGRLKTGSTVSLVLDAAHDAVVGSPVVPVSAIVRSPLHADRFAVFVVEQIGGRSIVRAREVELGDYLGREVPATSGLVQGERIVVQGAKLISDGEEVEVIP